MDFINKFGNIVNKGIDSIKSQINKTQENSLTTSQQYNNLPKGVHILGETENENQAQNQYSNFFGNEQINDNNIKNLNSIQQNNINHQTNQLNQNKVTTSSSMFEYFKTNANNNSNNYNNYQSFPPQNIVNQVNQEPDKEFMKGFNLIHGEKYINWTRCLLKLEKGPYPCRVLLTEYRLYIIPLLDNFYLNFFPEGYFSLLLHKIKKVNKIQKPQTLEYFLEIIMNDERIILLIFKTGINGEDLPHNLNNLLSNLETPSFCQMAIQYNKNNDIYKKENYEDGWKLYDPEKEYQRQGITNLGYDYDTNKLFRKTNLNENYLLCSTYPTYLITLGSITDSNYKESSLFRTKQRLPTLSYYYYNSRGTIWRSSQSKTGLSGNRNPFDEELMNKITEIGNSKKLFIYDCRPYLAAMANKIKGAGYENVENYKNAELFFCEIDNIHTARNSLNKIYSLLKSNNFYQNKKSISNFENTSWPNFIYGIIQASINIALAVKEGSSVLIHCSDGWDRASQVTAFSQLLIDPYFRTIKGYMTLIEKDFVSFGHQFRYRNGYCSKEEVSENQESPILLQYLDATHQLLVQYPMYFEFNMKFLLFIANNIKSGLYGTFLFNNENEREKRGAKDNTMSIWTEILNDIDKYKNNFYEKKTKEEYFFTPIFPFNRIRLWEEFFLPLTQINLNLSYNEYIDKYSGNYFNFFGQTKKNDKNRIISNIIFYEKVKEEYIKNINKKNKEIENLKKLIKILCIDNSIDKNIYENLPSECNDVLKYIARVNGGKISLNEEENKYSFKKTKNMFEGIIKDKNENEIKKEEINKIEIKKEDIKNVEEKNEKKDDETGKKEEDKNKDNNDEI